MVVDLCYEGGTKTITVDYESMQLSKKINTLQKDIGAKKKARDWYMFNLWLYLIRSTGERKCRHACCC